MCPGDHQGIAAGIPIVIFSLFGHFGKIFPMYFLTITLVEMGFKGVLG
jgi:hypothetical protein